MAALAGECQEVLVTAVFTLHAGETVVQVAAVQIPVDDLLYIGTEKSIESFKTFPVDLEKDFKMILHAPVIISILRIPGTVNGGGCGQDSSPLRKSDRRIIERSFYLSRGKILRPARLPYEEVISSPR